MDSIKRGKSKLQKLKFLHLKSSYINGTTVCRWGGLRIKNWLIPLVRVKGLPGRLLDLDGYPIIIHIKACLSNVR